MVDDFLLPSFPSYCFIIRAIASGANDQNKIRANVLVVFRFRCIRERPPAQKFGRHFSIAGVYINPIEIGNVVAFNREIDHSHRGLSSVFHTIEIFHL